MMERAMNLKCLALVSVLVPLLSACLGKSTPAADTECYTEVLELNESSEILGSSARFDAELQNAGRDSEPVTLGDVTRAAGWTDGWDRMVDVQPGMGAAELSRAAKVYPIPGCWRGIPDEIDSGTSVPWGYYLFLANGKPAQVVRWTGDKKPLRLGDRIALTPPSILVRDPKEGLLPAP
jgi:hypothetical protein